MATKASDDADLNLSGILEVKAGAISVGNAAFEVSNDIEYSGAGSPTITLTETPVDTFTDSPTMTVTPTVTDSFTETEVLSPTSTPTATETFTESATLTISATQSGTSTLTPTPTITNTSTPTPSLTATQTPLSTTYVWYDGDVPGAELKDGTGSASTAPTGSIGMIETAGTGPAGGTHFLDVTFSAGATTGWGSAAYYHAGAPIDLSSYNTLTFYMRTPSNSCAIHDAFRPAVKLNFPAAYPADHSEPVTATAYVVGAGEPTPDTWVKVEIPLSAFFGFNDNGVNIVPASLTLTTGVTFAAPNSMFNNGAALYCELQIDKVQFEQRTTNIPVVGNVGLVLDDFENTQSNLWGGGAWQLEYGFNCSAQGLSSTTITYPPGQPVTEGATMPPVTDSNGNTISPCHAGHIAGTLGQTGVDCPKNSGNWSIADLRTYFSTAGWTTVTAKAIDLTNNNYVRGLAATGAVGMKIYLKTTVHSGQYYQIQLVTTDSVNNGSWDHYSYQIGDKDAGGLTDSNWHLYTMPFPTGAAAMAGANPHSGSTTQLWWGQAGWGNSIAWTQNDFMQLKIRVMNPGAFDLWVDDVSFY